MNIHQGIPPTAPQAPLFDLQGQHYSFVQFNEDIRAVANDFSLGDNITGAVVVADNGEYTEIWATESQRPFDISAIYVKVKG